MTSGVAVLLSVSVAVIVGCTVGAGLRMGGDGSH
jgi:hypothetical protein